MSAPQLACYGRLGRERGADDAEATLWLGVVAFGRVAENLARHRSGEQVSVSGRLQLSRFVTGDP